MNAYRLLRSTIVVDRATEICLAMLWGAGQLGAETSCSCPKIYLPVCGEDNKTYGNECLATKCGRVKVAYSGVCRSAHWRTFEDPASGMRLDC
jgi:hypothetical protein